jgi:EAL domain-containing protein (putative c-di-GMP-specific phosphodiesterase class I)
VREIPTAYPAAGTWATIAWQPVVNVLSPRDVVADEALARFSDGRHPLEWFAEATAAGTDDELESVLLETALRNPPSREPHRRVTVNLTPRLLLAPRVSAVLESFDLSKVVIELTEHEPMPSSPEFTAALAALVGRGALLALDDTGRGYTGLTQVAEVRPHWVKIDAGVVADCDVDAVARASLSMYVRVARRVGALTVAEGVERAAQLTVLVDLGVDLAQGWLFGAPQGAPPAVRVEAPPPSGLGSVAIR